MDEERSNPFDAGMPDAFADVPLFREIQRVLLSSSGPVNWELARQVGIAGAQGGQPDPAAGHEDQEALEEASRFAELQIAEFTGLPAPTDVASVKAVRRAGWVESNIDGLKALIEPAARRIGNAIAQGEMPVETGQEQEALALGNMQQLLGQMSPLLLGAQVGTVLGELGSRVLGQYDIAVPRADPGPLLYVVANLAAFERDWSLPPTEFRTLIALHEVTHRFEFSRTWTRDRFRELLDDFLSTLELDLSDLNQRLAGIDASDPSQIQGLMESEEGLFGTVLDDEQRLKLGRIQAFMSAAEGYADHVMHALGAKLLPAYARIDEAMRRYRETEVGDPVFERLLGIEMKREQYRTGRAFCDTVVELTDEATLSRMWESAEAMPSLPEIEEPRLWLARTV